MLLLVLAPWSPFARLYLLALRTDVVGEEWEKVAALPGRARTDEESRGGGEDCVA